jgi:CheY-like chemotaxis protein
MKRILIVDDEPHVIRIMRLALEKAGYSVEEAGNGQQALEKIRSNPPDLLISDIDMPRMNGRELCSRIMEEMPERKFGIFILTARAEDEHRYWSTAMGNLDFLEKPVSIRRLLGRLDQFFVSNNFSGVQQCQPMR